MNEDRILYENYLKFKNCLKDRNFPRYEEPDLIEIFDVAGDNGDYYVQTEVLLLGARLFPESEELFQRRGFIYNRVSPSTLHAFLQDFDDGEGLAWEILKLRDRNLVGQDAAEELDRLLDEIDSLSDEDIIRLSEYARDVVCDEWFLKNRNKIEKKAEYRDTALYETASIAHDYAEDELALQLLDKLTRIDAFRAENWMLMAECHYSLKQYDEALKDLEYARAINPEDVEIDYIEAMNLVNIGGNDEKVITLFSRFLKSNPRSLPAIHQTACALDRLGRRDECASFLMNKFLEDVSDRMVMEELLSYDGNWDTRQIVSAFRSNSSDCDSFDSFVRENLEFMFRGCNYEEVIKITDLYYDVVKSQNLIDQYLYSLVMTSRYDRLIELYRRAVTENIDNMLKAPDDMLYFAFAMLKKGNYSEASEIAEAGLALNKFWANSTERLLVVACRSLFKEIISLSKSCDRQAIDSFDPFEPELFVN